MSHDIPEDTGRLNGNGRVALLINHPQHGTTLAPVHGPGWVAPQHERIGFGLCVVCEERPAIRTYRCQSCFEHRAVPKAEQP